jgi:hypothetical protein
MPRIEELGASIALFGKSGSGHANGLKHSPFWLCGIKVWRLIEVPGGRKMKCLKDSLLKYSHSHLVLASS